MASMSYEINALLQNLIESAHQSWAYAIFWQAFHSGQEFFLIFGGSYHKGEEDEGKVTNSSLSSIFPTDQRKQLKKTLDELILAYGDSNDDAFKAEVSDTEWFVVLSMTLSIAKGSGFPGHAWQNSNPVWIMGRENLATSYCERSLVAQAFGIRTMVFIPSEIGVIELGSTGLNFRSLELLNQGVALLNYIRSLGKFWDVQRMEIAPPVQPGDESESKSYNSTKNSKAIIRSDANHHWCMEDEELSLGLHLSLKACPVKPVYKSKCSSSSVGNYPVPVVKEKENPQFSGKLQLGSHDDSDSTDISTFVRILKRRRR